MGVIVLLFIILHDVIRVYISRRRTMVFQALISLKINFLIVKLMGVTGLNTVVVVVGHTPLPKMVEGSNNHFYAHRPMVSPHLASIRARWLPGGPLYSTSRCPTSTGAVHNSVTFRCVFMLVQLNKCVVCGSDLKRGHSCDGCLSSSILFEYEHSKGHLFVLSWVMVRRVALGSVLDWYGVCDFVVLSVVEVCADYGGVTVFHVYLNLGGVYGVGVCVNVPDKLVWG